MNMSSPVPPSNENKPLEQKLEECSISKSKTPEPVTTTVQNGESDLFGKVPTLREQFKAFSKFGDTKSDGKHLTLSQSDKWMKQAKVIDPKGITTTDTAIHFKKFKQMKISYQDYEKYLTDLAKAKKIDEEPIKNKLRNAGLPGTNKTTAVLKNEAVDRLTDTKKFTGSHKVKVEEKKTPKKPASAPPKAK